MALVRRSLAAALSLAVLCTPAAAQGQAQQDDQQVICKDVELPASRFKRRLCGTRAQWDRMAEVHKAMYNEIQNRPVIYIGR